MLLMLLSTRRRQPGERTTGHRRTAHGFRSRTQPNSRRTLRNQRALGRRANLSGKTKLSKTRSFTVIYDRHAWVGTKFKWARQSVKKNEHILAPEDLLCVSLCPLFIYFHDDFDREQFEGVRRNISKKKRRSPRLLTRQIDTKPVDWTGFVGRIDIIDFVAIIKNIPP